MAILSCKEYFVGVWKTNEHVHKASLFFFNNRDDDDGVSGDDALTTIVNRPQKGKNGATKNAAHLNQVIENDYVSDVNKRSKK